MGGGGRIGLRNKTLSSDQLNIIRAADRLEVIDVSRGWEGRGFDITGHRYWIQHPWASSDTILALRTDLDPEDRALQATETEFLWAIPADYPTRLRDSLTREDLQIRRPE